MFYEINLTKHGKHISTTPPNTITTKEALDSAAELYRKLFPPKEGYRVRKYEADYGYYRPIK